MVALICGRFNRRWREAFNCLPKNHLWQNRVVGNLILSLDVSVSECQQQWGREMIAIQLERMLLLLLLRVTSNWVKASRCCFYLWWQAIAWQLNSRNTCMQATSNPPPPLWRPLWKMAASDASVARHRQRMWRYNARLYITRIGMTLEAKRGKQNEPNKADNAKQN